MGNLGRAVQELLVGFEGIHMDLDFESGALVVAAYIFMSLGLFAIAKNRRIQNPWLAWIPVGNLWLLGCISDQYRYVALGQKQNRRKRLLILSILEAAAIPLAVLLFVLFFAGVRFAALAGDVMSAALFVLCVILFFALFALVIGVIVVFVLLQIQRFKAYCDLFSSCMPKKAKLFSTVSIIACCFGIDLAAAILVFICRNKEEGMPPRVSE